MERLKSDTYFDKDAILQDILQILRDMTSDWEMGFTGTIEPTTYLAADLAFESIHLVRLVIAIEEHFKLRELPFQHLFMSDERQVNDLRVLELVDFLYKQLNHP